MVNCLLAAAEYGPNVPEDQHVTFVKFCPHPNYDRVLILSLELPKQCLDLREVHTQLLLSVLLMIALQRFAYTDCIEPQMDVEYFLHIICGTKQLH